MSKLRVGSLFSGVGGMDRGLELAGWEVAFQIENDPACQRVLARHWPDVPRFGDIREVDPADLPAVDLLAGGFPCQDLSVAGRRAGLAGARSGLVYEFLRLAAALAPAWVLVENVPGLLSSHGGRDMGTLVGLLGECGYGWAYRCLDAQHFGVAQRRNRVFIVGHPRAERAAAVLFEPESGGGHPAPGQEAGARIAASAAAGPGDPGEVTTYHVNAWASCAKKDHAFEADYARCIDSAGAYAPGQGGTLVAHALSAHGPRLDPNGEDFLIAHSLNDPHGGVTEDGTGRGVPLIAFHQTQDPIHGDVAPTFGATSLGMGAQQGPVVRRLTPVECHRLMGLPDDWCAGETDSTQYRLLGNSVVVPVVQWLGERLLAER